MATMTELGGKVAAAAAVRAVMPTFTAMGTTGSVKVTDEVVAGVPVVKVRVRVSTTWADNMEAEAKARTDGIGVVVARGTVGTVRLTYNWRIKTYAIYDEMGTTVGQGALAQVTHALTKLFDEMTA